MVTLSDAVKDGQLEGLYALRDSLASEIEAGPQGEKAVSQTAPLARQLRDVLKDIAVLEKESPKASVVDDLAARRKARRSDTASPPRAAGDHGK